MSVCTERRRRVSKGVFVNINVTSLITNLIGIKSRLANVFYWAMITHTKRLVTYSFTVTLKLESSAPIDFDKENGYLTPASLTYIPETRTSNRTVVYWLFNQVTIMVFIYTITWTQTHHGNQL